MTSVAERLLTADEFLELPDDPSGGKMELVAGRVVTMCPVGEEHGDVAWIVAQRLSAFATRHKLGKVRQEVGFVIARDPDTVRAPDVWFLSKSAEPAGRNRKKFIPTCPSLAVEVVSPTDRQREILEKVGEYLDAGTQRIWIVRPARETVTVFDPDGGVAVRTNVDTLTSEDAGFDVPGFELPVAEIFAEE